jgi:hypothetical protein
MVAVMFRPLFLNMVAVMFRPLFLKVVAVMFRPSPLPRVLSSDLLLAIFALYFLTWPQCCDRPLVPTMMEISPATAYLVTRLLETMFLQVFRRSGANLPIFEFHTRFIVQ